jgi:hypothetical protein
MTSLRCNENGRSLNSTSLRSSIKPGNERPFQLLKSLLKSLWRSLSDSILSGSYEPKVRHKVDRQGRIVSWQVFDPESGRIISFGSELEVRLWLEQRYYR